MKYPISPFSVRPLIDFEIHLVLLGKRLENIAYEYVTVHSCYATLNPYNTALMFVVTVAAMEDIQAQRRRRRSRSYGEGDSLVSWISGGTYTVH
jgi:hypothetical protein